MIENEAQIECINAITMYTANMLRAVRFYRAMGFRVRYGGENARFTSFHVGSGYLNLMTGAVPKGHWGRVILYVSNVEAMHRRATDAGFEPEGSPADAPWGERYFHLRDPDGNELSFARPIL